VAGKKGRKPNREAQHRGRYDQRLNVAGSRCVDEAESGDGNGKEIVPTKGCIRR
jgi:hypothetical protein